VKKHLFVPAAVLAAAALVVPNLCLAQDNQPSIDNEIQSLRADMRADKVTIITQAMRFNDKDAAAFWPVYKKYEFELSKINDAKVELIKDYANKFGSLNDADAKTMADKAFDIEGKRLDLRKKYYKEFNKVLPALTVTKYFQLEHRLDLLVDLQLASQLPSLLVQQAPAK
jgi:hypothetical protein